jgi:hypothetical protein
MLYRTIHPGTDINEAPSVLLIRWGLLSLGLLFSWTFSHIMDAAPVVSFLQQLITNIIWLFLSCSRTSLRKRFLAYRTPYIQSFVSTTSFLCGSTYWTFCRGPCPSTTTISVPTVARFPPFRPFVMSMSERSLKSMPMPNALVPLTQSWLMIGCADGNLRVYSCRKSQMRLLGFAFRETMKMKGTRL